MVMIKDNSCSPIEIGIVYFPALWFDILIPKFDPAEVSIFVFWNNLKSQVLGLYGDRYKIYDLNDPSGIAAYNKCDVIMADQSGFTMVHDRYQCLKDPNKISVVLSHATDSPPLNFFSKYNLLVSSSEYCSKASIEPLSRYIKNSDLDNIVIDIAYSGLYHIDLVECRRKFTRDELVNSFSLNPDRPIITCFIDEISDFNQVHIGLKALSEHFNVLYKSYGTWSELYQFSELNVIDDARYNNLLRFGSDYILAGSQSGTLTSCAMLGMRVIPYHTEIIYNNCKDRERYYKSLKTGFGDTLDLEQVASISFPRHKWHGFNKVIESLLITNIDAIVKLVNDKAFWDVYEHTANEWQSSSFGKYHLHDSADVVYSLVKSLHPRDEESCHKNIIYTINS